MIKLNQKLEKYIFEVLGACYQRNIRGSGSNLNNDENLTKAYLGTYFPRSYVEAETIYSNIFRNPLIINSLEENESIEILIVGSGTGGDLFGLLSALIKHLSNKEINIYSIDGNNTALEYQKKIFDYLYHYDYNICLNCENIVFKNKSEILNKIGIFAQGKKFNIISSFKFASEFYSNGSNSGTYIELLKVGEQYLVDNGLLLIEDITNQVGSDFIVNILSNESQDYFVTNRNNTDLVYILPKPCALWHKECSRKCFSKKEFFISHRGRIRDDSRVTYRLFVKGILGFLLLEVIKNEGVNCYHIFENNYCERAELLYDYPEPPNGIKVDAFSL